MNKRFLFWVALLGTALLWSAIIAEIFLRYTKVEIADELRTSAFLTLFILSLIATLSTGWIGAAVTKRYKFDTPKKKDKPKSAPKSAQKKRAQQGSRNKRTNKSAARIKEKDSSTVSAKQTTPSGNQTRVTGRIKTYIKRQAYGFVEDENKQAAFFHKRNLAPEVDTRDLIWKKKVSYVIEQSERGPVANDIRIES